MRSLKANSMPIEEDVNRNKRDEILSEAARLFRRKGYSGTSMQDIASEVGILKGSIYYHFKSKDEIFREVLQKGISPVLKKAEFIYGNKSTPREILRQLIENHVNYIINNDYSLVIFSQEKEKISDKQTRDYVLSRNRYEKIFKDVLAEGIKAGDFPQVDVSLTVLAILGMCNSIIQWYNPAGRNSSAEITAHMAHLTMDLMLRKPD